MRLLLAGGGTGGHLFPAVALAQQLLEEEWQAQVLFVGTDRGIEARILPELNLPLKTIDISGLVGLGWKAKLTLLPQLLRSVRQSMEILESFAPDVVVGVGGYASGPVLLAAKLKRIPFIIHEQNAAFGLTNRLLSRWAERICLSFERTDQRRTLQERTVLTGNPVRRGIALCPPLPETGQTLLVFGGSRGAQALNQAVVAALPALRTACPELTIIHQTGTDALEEVRAGYRAAGWDPEQVTPFIDNMADAYARARLVLCRAGATTLAELTVCGRPAVLVPYPFAAADHQTGNARLLAEKGAALLLPQSELNGAKLAQLLGGLLNDQPTLERMSVITRSLGCPDATDRLLDQCRAVARGN